MNEAFLRIDSGPNTGLRSQHYNQNRKEKENAFDLMQVIGLGGNEHDHENDVLPEREEESEVMGVPPKCGILKATA
jgi:hypothetical protein